MQAQLGAWGANATLDSNRIDEQGARRLAGMISTATAAAASQHLQQTVRGEAPTAGPPSDASVKAALTLLEQMLQQQATTRSVGALPGVASAVGGMMTGSSSSSQADQVSDTQGTMQELGGWVNTATHLAWYFGRLHAH